jgi:hypothetical protein
MFVANVNLPLFLIAMVYGGLANGSAFVVLGRMRSLGYPVGIWRTPSDAALYREYWRIARSKNWSRVPIVLFYANAVLAAGLMFAAIRHFITR